MSTGQDGGSGARVRTRTAILDAAVERLAVDAQASMSDVAEAAHVGRTTVHRYFPERADLVLAVVDHVVELSRQAVARAEPHSGPVRAALRRVVEEHFGLGSILMYVYAEPLIVGDPRAAAELERMELTLDEILARPDAGLHPHLTGPWVRRVFWGIVYAGWQTFEAGEMPRHQVIDAIMTTLTDGVYDTVADSA